MNPSAATPVYNLKAVVRETGLKPDTIRAWERRYGLPEPRRTESGHRLYSRNDINMLKWLVARQAEGVSISRAVVLWRRLAELHDDSTAVTYHSQHQAPPPAPESRPLSVVDNLAQLREAWLIACLNFDEQTAERVVAQAFALFAVEVVCSELLQRGLAEMGEGWFAGRVTVQQEHFASALATRRLEALLAATPAPTRPSRIAIACPPGEMHVFAPMLLTLLLRRRGWEIIYLGADVPLVDLIATTRATHLQLIVLVAQQLTTAATLLEMGQLLFNERVPMAFGGCIFAQLPELSARISGHYLGDSLEGSVQAIENIVALPRIQTAQVTIDPEHQLALLHFKTHLAQIEADVWRHARAAGIDHTHLEMANIQLSRNLAAALAFGDMAVLRPQLEWAQQRIDSEDRPATWLFSSYLSAYVAAVDQQLDAEGALISHWLRREITAKENRSSTSNGESQRASTGRLRGFS